MPEVQNETAAEKLAKGPNAQRAGRVVADAVEAERRSFEEGARQGAVAASTGFEAAREMARRSAEATRQIAESGRRTTFEIADLWRDTLEPVLRTQLEFGRWFGQAWRQTNGLGGFSWLGAGRPFGAGAMSLLGLPPADLKETDTAYELGVELPGLSREDIDVKIEGDLITVAGAKAEESADAAAYRISERRFGHFQRSFPVPPDVRREAIAAACANGVLTITLPKAPESVRPPERIAIR